MVNLIKRRRQAEADLTHYFKRLTDLFKYEKDQAILDKEEIDEFHRIIVELGEFALRLQRKTEGIFAEKQLSQLLEAEK